MRWVYLRPLNALEEAANRLAPVETSVTTSIGRQRTVDQVARVFLNSPVEWSWSELKPVLLELAERLDQLEAQLTPDGQ